MDVRVGPLRRQSTKELMLSNHGAREDLRVPCTARRSSQSILKEIKPEFIGRTDAETEALLLWLPDVKS